MRTIGLDKTGTLTEGRESIGSNWPRTPPRVLMRLACWPRRRRWSEERTPTRGRDRSRSPAARIVIAHGGGDQHSSGIRRAGADRRPQLMIGRAPWLEEVGGRIPEGLRKGVDSVTGTVVWVARDTNVIGAIVLADAIKPNAVEAVRSLRELGCTVHLASGDRAAVARSVAAQVGIEQVLPDALPEDKQRLIRSLQQAGQVVAMVGDGINDAPSLAAADVGIAMGTGTDVAIETADVSLVAGDPRALAEAIRLSRRVMTNIRQNLFFAFAYNAIGIPIAAGVLYPWLGWTLSPMVAAAAMSFSSVSVIGNALRLRT
ncbi:MAG: HAD-IC family P-type ATPase [Pirellulaceae bacterium]